MLTTLTLILSLPVYAGLADIAQTPIDAGMSAKPNLIFGLDDSGSMDWSTMLPTESGLLWYDRSRNSYFNSDGSFASKPSYYRIYAYLFPNGYHADARHYSDSDGYYAVPPVGKFGFARSSDYNTMYYNPMVDYKPWPEGYYNGSVRTFTNANPQAARSHPLFPASGNPTTINLTQNKFSTSSGWVFHMEGGMTIPGGDIPGVKYYSIWRWRNINYNYNITGSNSYYVAIPYYPATYFMKDASCISGPDCFTISNGDNIRRYEIKPGKTFPSGRSYADEIQNFANWFTYHRKRRLMLSAAMGEVLSTTTGMRGGVVKFNNLTHVTMYDFDSSASSNNAKALLGQVYANPASGGTPLRLTLKHIGEQYKNRPSIINSACQINAAMILTDGYGTGSSTSVPSYNASLYTGAAPYTTVYDQSLAQLASSYYTNNIRPDLTAGQVSITSHPGDPNPDNNTNLHMNTYAMTFGAFGTIYGTNSPSALDPFTTPPSWPSPRFDGDPSSVDDLWHATINGRGKMFDAVDFSGTVTKFQTAIRDIALKGGAGSAAGLPKSYLGDSANVAYISNYNTNYGELKSVGINASTGQINLSQVNWSAQALLDAKPWATRVIATYNGSAGIPFAWDQLTTTQKYNLQNQTVLNWLRGDNSLEGIIYRTRNHKLGDIVYAEPVVVAGATAKYADATYTEFANSIANRPKMIYQAANDGMLHAFNATTGQEHWAYIPSHLMTQLKKLSDTDYQHQFTVDATPVTGDVKINHTWKTILVGGLRAGGSGFYALDITHPETASSDSLLAAKVLWEFPNSSTPAEIKNNIGLSFGKPIIAKTHAHGWVVIVSSGYNHSSDNGRGRIFVLNPADGSLIQEIQTTAGTNSTPAGLAQLAAFATNPITDPIIEAIYGGDLLGNVWRFDLSGETTSSWNVRLLAQLVDDSGTPQPVTTEPELAVHDGRRMVFVGTGKLLGLSDISNSQHHTMYAMVDDLSTNPAIANVRASLMQRSLSGNQISSSTPVDYSVYKGWYLDLAYAGEKINTNPVLAFDALIFNANYPSSSACSAESFQYLVDLKNGIMLDDNLFESGNSWARKQLGNTLVTRPVIAILANRKAISVSLMSNNTTVTTEIPKDLTVTITRRAWKEIFR